ncbi:MAG: hypothetical protein M3R60_04330 [Pseudomonadota bacterium]|nr:hypothetical protein [Pseudomonadota bacterium]
MRIACLLFLCFLLAALLARLRLVRSRQASISRFTVVRMALLLIRIATLEIRYGLLMIRYGRLVLLTAIVACIRRRSSRRREAQRLGCARVRPVALGSVLRCRQRPMQGWLGRAATPRTQTPVRARRARHHGAIDVTAHGRACASARLGIHIR